MAAAAVARKLAVLLHLLGKCDEMRQVVRAARARRGRWLCGTVYAVEGSASGGRQVGIGARRLSGTLPTSHLRSAKVSWAIRSQSVFVKGSGRETGICNIVRDRLFIPYS